MSIRAAYLEGNLTREPELVAVNDWSIVKFSIACNESIKQADGNFKDTPHFFDCEYWTKKPQYWLQKMTKGTGVIVQTAPTQDRWEHDGQTRSKIKFKLTAPPVIRSSAQSAMDAPAQPQQTDYDDIPF